MNSCKVGLTQNQILFLLDSTSIFTATPESTDINDQIRMQKLKDFRLKLLSGIIYPATEVNLTFTSSELWLALEVSKSGVQIGQEKIGLELINIFGKALIEISSELDLATNDIDESLHTERGQEKVKQFKEYYDNSANKDNPTSNDNPKNES